MQVTVCSNFLDKGGTAAQSLLSRLDRQSHRVGVMHPDELFQKVQDQPIMFLARALIPERFEALESQWNKEKQLLKSKHSSFESVPAAAGTDGLDPETCRRVEAGVHCIS
jgi:hypothetical protein